MNAADLKNNLHKLIDETDDLDFLKKIEEAFLFVRARQQREQSNSNALSAEEAKLIEEGMNSLDEGEVVSNQEAKEQFAKWLNRNNE